MKPPETADIKDYLTPEMPVIDPDENSKFGHNVPDIVFTYGDKRAGLKKVLRVLPTFLRTKKNIEKGFIFFKSPWLCRSTGSGFRWRIQLLSVGSKSGNGQDRKERSADLSGCRILSANCRRLHEYSESTLQ